MGKKYSMAALAAAGPCGVLAAGLHYVGWLIPGERAAWMLFWLAGALQVWLLTQRTPQAPPQKKNQPQTDGWFCPGREERPKDMPRTDPLAGLGPGLAGACCACQLGALGHFCLQLPAVAAALWCGGTAAALVWLLLCLVALFCTNA